MGWPLDAANPERAWFSRTSDRRNLFCIQSNSSAVLDNTVSRRRLAKVLSNPRVFVQMPTCVSYKNTMQAATFRRMRSVL
jgi:hypothetical protein